MSNRRKEGYAMAVQVTHDTFDRPLGKMQAAITFPAPSTRCSTAASS